MKILITGGAGFIGSHLADRFIANKHEICIIDNFATGSPRNLEAHKNIPLIEGTIADFALVNKTISDFRPTVVIHAAASYKDPNAWDEDVRTNVLGTSNVVKASLAAGVSRLIYFQTALCYGLHPMEQPITLNHPIRPEGSSYAFSKTAGEQYIELSKIPYTTFRLANAYGPRNVSGPLPTFFQRLSEGKRCFVTDTRRDFIFVEDLVNVVYKAVTEAKGSGAYHISSGRDYPIQELFDATVAAMGIKLNEPVEVRKRAPDDVFSILLDPSRTRSDFDWDVKVPLTEGVRRAIHWYQQYGIAHTFTHLKHEETKR